METPPSVNEDKSVRYQRLQRRAAVASVCVSAGVPALLLATGGSHALRDASYVVTGGNWLLAAAAYAVLFVLLHEAVQLPLAFYSSYGLSLRYGLSSETASTWLRDYLKATAITIVVASGAAAFVYVMLRTGSSWWWLGGGVAATAIGAALARLFPTMLLPWFYRFKPLERPDLRARVEALSRQAGVPVVGVYEWALGEKSRRANAAVVGLGGSRRILLSDTLLSGYTEDEIEVILAHELAHHVHGDIPKSLALEGAVMVMAFGAAALALRWWGPAVGLTSPSDLAGLPLLVLAGGGVMLVASPIQHAFARANERRADAYALRLTGRPAAFTSAMRRLAAQNLIEMDPPRLALWLFHSHPAVQERIDRADLNRRIFHR